MGTLARFFTRSAWGKSLLLLLLFNALVRLVAVGGYFLLPSRFAPLDFIAPLWQSNFLFWSLANFDGEHYLSIAEFGYQVRNGFPQYAFFPLYPLLIRLMSFFTRDLYLAGLLVSQLSLYLALTFLAKWTTSLKLRSITPQLLLSPGAVFLASIYSEPLFLALAAMTMYFCESKQWGRATLLTALATATRVNGIFLAIFLLVKIYKSSKSSLISISYFFISLGGLASYMLFLYFKTGDPLAWFHAQGAWGKAVATSPLTTLVSYLRAISVDFSPDLTHLVVIFEVLVTLTLFALFVALLRSHLLDLSYWLYLALNLALPITTGSLGSMPRFILTLYPLFVVLPSLPKVSRALYYIVSTLVATAGTILFTRGYWYG